MKNRPVDDKGKVRLFVYGTLKNGHHNSVLLDEAKAQLIGHDSIHGRFNLFDLGGFPAITDGNKLSHIRGELYSLPDDEALAAIDHLEGHPNFYRRRKVWTHHLHKRAWVYVLASDTWAKRSDNITDEGVWKPSDLESLYWKRYDPKSRKEHV